MFQRSFVLLVLCLCCFPLFCSGAAIPVDGYAAIVSDRVITIGEVMQYLRPVEMELRKVYEGAELNEQLEAAFIKSREALIERALIISDFTASEMQIPEQLIDERLNTIIHEQFDDDRTAFLEALSNQRMSTDEMRSQVREGLVLMLMRRQEVSDRVNISPLAVLELYESNAEKFQQPGQVHLRMIAINKGVTAEDQDVKAQEVQGILSRLQAGEDFSELAKEVSEDNKAQYGGDWGWIEAENLRAELAETAAALNVGEVSDIIDVGDTIYIMTVEARKEAGMTPLDEVRPQLEQQLKAKEEERLFDEWMNRLRAKYYIQIING